MNGFKYRRLVAQAIIGASSFVSRLPSNSGIDFSGTPTRAQYISDKTCQSIRLHTSPDFNTSRKKLKFSLKKKKLAIDFYVVSQGIYWNKKINPFDCNQNELITYNGQDLRENPVLAHYK
jgi:hypothetical protein